MVKVSWNKELRMCVMEGCSKQKAELGKKKMHDNINLDKNGGVKSEIEVYK